MNYVKHYNILGNETKEIPCIVGAGVPSNTIAEVGLLYMDRQTGDLYKRTTSGWTIVTDSINGEASPVLTLINFENGIGAGSVQQINIPLTQADIPTLANKTDIKSTQQVYIDSAENLDNINNINDYTYHIITLENLPIDTLGYVKWQDSELNVFKYYSIDTAGNLTELDGIESIPVTNAKFDNVSNGIGSVTMGGQNISVGNYSVTEGYRNQTFGSGSHAEGLKTIAKGPQSHTEGCKTLTWARQSHAEGYKTVAGTEEAYNIDSNSADGQGSGVIACHAEGDNTEASGSKSHAEGSYSKATGRVSHAEGGLTEASGYYAHSENYQTKAVGIGSHAEGYFTSAAGNYSHAENDNTKANGIGSHAEGYATEANAEYSHAEGHTTKAYGRYSYAGGVATTSTGAHSHVRGTRNKIDTELQSRFTSNIKCSLTNLKNYPLGENETYNLNDVVLYNNIYWRYKGANGTTTNVEPGTNIDVWADTSDYRGKYLEIVGNGVEGAPSNAYTLDWDGNAWFAGSLSRGDSIATGESSYAEGSGANAYGNYSHAEGEGTIATGKGERVSGRFNIPAVQTTSYSSTTKQYTTTNTERFFAGQWEENEKREEDGYWSGAVVEHKGILYVQNIPNDINVNRPDDVNSGWTPLNNIYMRDYAQVVGNGTDAANRSNAYTLDWNGHGTFAGGASTNGYKASSGLTVNTTPQFRNIVVAPAAPTDLSNLAIGDIVFTIWPGEEKTFSVTHMKSTYSFKFAEGMTWRDWIESDYSQDSNNRIQLTAGQGIVYCSNQVTTGYIYEQPDDLIEAKNYSSTVV